MNHFIVLPPIETVFPCKLSSTNRNRSIIAMEQYILDFRKCSSKMAEGGPPDLETQKTEIGNLLKTQLKKGDTW